MRRISEAEVQTFLERGLLHLPDLLIETEKSLIADWVAELSGRPDTPGKWMKYYEPAGGEQTGEGGAERKILSRIENFMPFHEGFAELFGGDKLIDEMSKLMGEAAVLFKEKINFKLPGGGGFLPHQDAPAFTTFNQTFHITLMVSVSRATNENGCLEFAYDYEKEKILRQGSDGAVHPELAERMNWEELPAEPGDVVFFDSYIPHRSPPNLSATSRTAIFITYNKASEGLFRDEYYEHKRQVFPQDCEKDPNKDYSKGAEIYNLGNPIK